MTIKVLCGIIIIYFPIDIALMLNSHSRHQCMLSNDTKTIIIYMYIYIYKFVEFKAKIVSFSMCPDLTFRGSVLDAGHLMKNDKSLVSKTALLAHAQ